MRFVAVSFAFAAAVALSAPAVMAAAPAPSAPPAEFIDRDACPFECCTYREWQTTGNVWLIDRPRGSRIVARILSGAKVTGVTGEVISRPARTTALVDLGEGIEAGDVFYVLHYEGEGYYAVWFDGRKVSIQPDPLHPLEQFAVWWVKIRTADGRVGWTINNDNFTNQDACG